MCAEIDRRLVTTGPGQVACACAASAGINRNCSGLVLLGGGDRKCRKQQHCQHDGERKDRLGVYKQARPPHRKAKKYQPRDECAGAHIRPHQFVRALVYQSDDFLRQPKSSARIS